MRRGGGHDNAIIQQPTPPKTNRTIQEQTNTPHLVTGTSNDAFLKHAAGGGICTTTSVFVGFTYE